MSKMIQIRNVPEHVYHRLKAHAAEEGLSVSALLLRETIRVAPRPSDAEFFERLSKLPPVPLTSQEIVDAIRAERDARTDHIIEVLRRPETP